MALDLALERPGLFAHEDLAIDGRLLGHELSLKGELPISAVIPRETSSTFRPEHQAILARFRKPGAPRPKRRKFAFVGLMTCGECGRAITAEKKTNRHGTTYRYYRCTKRRLDYKCRQPVVQAAYLEEQIQEFLRRISVPQEIAAHVTDQLLEFAEEERATRASNLKRTEKTRASIERQLDALIKLRVRGLSGHRLAGFGFACSRSARVSPNPFAAS